MEEINIIDVMLPENKKEYDSYILLKFFEKEIYQQEFLDGKLFFNTVDFFAGCDQNGRGDLNEGNTFIIDYDKPNLISANFEKIDGEYLLVVRDYSDNPEAFKRGTIWKYSSAVNRNRKIISLFTLFLNLEKQKVSPIDAKLKECFGEYGILIINRQKFFERVVNSLINNKEYSNKYMAFVNYQPKEKQKGLMDWNPFIKNEEFSYQNEFRITFTSNSDQPLKLDLGCSLRDIVVPILSEDLYEIHFKNSNLFYPIYQ